MPVQPSPPPDRAVIVIVWDGLRPDVIDPADVPNLARLRDCSLEDRIAGKIQPEDDRVHEITHDRGKLLVIAARGGRAHQDVILPAVAMQEGFK